MNYRVLLKVYLKEHEKSTLFVTFTEEEICAMRLFANWLEEHNEDDDFKQGDRQ